MIETNRAMSAPDPEVTGQHNSLVNERPGQERRVATVRRLIVVGAVLALGAMGLFVLLYLRSPQIWQTLVYAASIALGLACLAGARWLVRLGRVDAAGVLVLLALAIPYGFGEMIWSGTTLYIVLGGILLIVLLGRLIWPQGWRIPLFVAGLYVAVVATVDWLGLFRGWQYNIMQSPVLRVLVPGLVILSALVVFWQFLRDYRLVGTIRARLLVAFVLIALLPSAGVSGGAIVIGTMTMQQQTQDQLISVAVLKRAEIDTWVDNLQTDLVFVLAGEDTTRYVRVLLLGSTSAEYLRTTHDTLQDRFRQAIEQTGRFDELFLMDLDGMVVLSTDDAQEGNDVHSIYDYFRQGLEGPYVNPPAYQPLLERTTVTVSRPVLDAQGQAIGVLAGHANMAVLDAIMAERAGLDETGETYLVGSREISWTQNREGKERGLRETWVPTAGVKHVLENRADGDGVGLYDNYAGEGVVGAYLWVPELESVLLAEQTQAEAFQAVYSTLGLIALVTLLSVVLAAAASLVVTRNIAAPLANLAETASRIAAGDLDRVAPVERADEVGALAQAFNTMTTRLRSLIDGLEQRVAERTSDLAERTDELTEMVATQQRLLETIREMSAPVVPIVTGVIVLPLVGAIDSQRAGHVVEELLTGIEEHRAQVVLVDITGVPVVDTQVAQLLLQSTSAARLLGTQVVLVGIRPEVAQTIVGLGIDLSGLVTRADLQGGVEYALRLVGRRTLSRSG